jgi:hypothetical protein
MRHHGYIVRYLPDKRFGFIASHGVGPKRLFFRRADIIGDIEPANGATVSYNLILDRHDRNRAVAVTLESQAT